MTAEQKFYDYLEKLGIAHDTFEHAPAMMASDLHDARIEALPFPVKNLFLRDKKKTQYWLVTMRLDAPSVDLKELGKKLEAKGRLSFGSPEDLLEMMHVTPGSVTPFGLLNDTEKRLKFILDQRAADAESLSGHPMRNDKTTTISKADFKQFCAALGYNIHYMDLPFKPENASEPCN